MTSRTSHVQETRFGTFGGVFTPCTLTILGVIMFLRFGEVVGNAGAWQGLLIVLLAKTITTLTALSLSAIATNTRVKGGGAYFLISRSLGVEFGGAIGVMFFLAQAVSVAMYVFGFTETVLAVFPELGLSPIAVASIVNFAVFVCVYIGAGWTIKLQYGILALLLASLASFYAGALEHFSLATLRENAAPGYVEGASLLTMFALFFPAATGIMAGANMSGDLREPSRAIPRGTLAAILFTGVIYASMALLLSGARPRAELVSDYRVVSKISTSSLLITLGIFAATLSSALGSMMGAPRILQALARDNVFPKLRLFGKGAGRSNEPRRATILSFLIAEGGILLGDLNAVAPIITMFFMITYGALNLATFQEARARNPSYRPTFRWSHWTTALLGAAGCLVAMVLISPLWALIAILAMGAMHWYVGRQEILATWGDVQSGAAFERARKTLLRLEEERYHPKNWRPSILALSGAAGTRVQLAIFAHWLAAGRGVLTLAQVIVGDIELHLARRQGQEKVLRRFIREQELDAFAAVIVSQDLPTGIEAMVQCSGIGALQPNVVMLGWSFDDERLAEFGTTLRTVASLGRSIVVMRIPGERDDPWTAPPGTIDVWWRGRSNGALMILLAHLLEQNGAWRGRTVRLLRMVPSEDGADDARRHLEALIQQARFRATAGVVVGRDFRSVLHTTSRSAAIVLLGFEPPTPGQEEAFVAQTNALVDGLPIVALVRSAEDMHLDG